MLCALGLHRVNPAVVWNEGVGFSRCLHCSRELVRRADTPWSRVPRGYRIVWRAARAAGAARDPLRANANFHAAAWRGAASRKPSARPAATDSRDRTPPRIIRRALGAGAALMRKIRKIGTAADRSLGALAPPREVASRSYRYLVRRVAGERRGTPLRTLLVSAVCGMGTANEAMLMLSAIMQDELGGRLLIVDATLAEDGIGTVLGVDGQPGLSEACAHDQWATLEMIHALSRPSLFILGAGLRPGASRPEDMAAILPFLAERFDHVLIQQRAITADTRNLAMAARADFVLVLAEEGRSRMDSLSAARTAFRSNGIHDLGLILTVPPAPGDDSRQGGRHDA
ncbi:tyrosine-protein kinase family protein [Sphingobium cloacae]|uniref:Capsular polysaccharide biosynthesis protein n=1 Tax=Sphingobium cloacae TaxID=120107 RepID=A0A1E1F3G5_9SPHN|nr:tyrosine-protein kinase family protein [Sphingobium cloacae]BAV64971.1 capsular polysaccharide biosynthesis protein [Sphingobium cloacae]